MDQDILILIYNFRTHGTTTPLETCSFEKKNMQKWCTRILFLLIIAFNLFSCKKDSSSAPPVSHTIKYQITSNNYQVFNNIYYIDTIGVLRQTDGVDSTNGWSKSITIHYSPFTAQLQVQGQNSTTSTLIYDLKIIVDGQLKADQPDSASKFNSFNTQASATIQ